MAAWQTISTMECLVEEGTNKDSCVVLFHGFGADATDLFPLQSMLDAKKKWTWIFPQGPQEVIIGPGFTGRAWFNIDMKALEQAMMMGTYRDLSQTRPLGLDQVSAQGQKFFIELQKKFKHIVLGGFSQGAMLATEMTLSAEVKPRGLVILSGTLLDKDGWTNKSKSLAGLSYFQSHGETDPLLNPEHAVDLSHILQRAGCKGRFYSFHGGHEIPMEIIEKLRLFLSGLLH